MKTHCLTSLLAICLGMNTVLVAGSLDLATAKLTFDDHGVVSELKFSDGVQWPSNGQPAFSIETAEQTFWPQSIEVAGDRWMVKFTNNAVAEFNVTAGQGFAVFRLVRLTPSEGVTRLQLFSLGTPPDARVAGTLNGATKDGRFAAVMAGEPNVYARSGHSGSMKADRAGCKHDFERCDDAKVGRGAVRFTATCNEQAAGWSVRGKSFVTPLNLTGCKAIRAWVHGDGNGQALKIQLTDGRGGYRDNYLAIDFQGWRQVTLAEPAFNTLHYDHVQGVSFYYNGLPASKTVTCLIDQVEALCEQTGVEQGGKEQVQLLEDFEATDSPLWSSPVVLLSAETMERHKIEPAAFGIIACPESEILATIERFEAAAGIPSPQLGGVWNKQSPWVKQSYLFLTNFRESQFDEALALARRGGFSTILLGQESWSLGTGHYDINRDRFADGLDGMKRTVQRFKDAGFRVGLHFLGASIYPPDPYLVPVPDARLVTGATATLAADIDSQAAFLPLESAPDKFPAEDGGYMGGGTVVRVGDELIVYRKRSLESPLGMAECLRGHLGTKAVAHAKGERVMHLVRSYGYHMYDMDTSLLDEVSSHFAKVANTCGIEMIYFDGSEALQGDHWYYNARLHKAFYDKLENKNTLLQASSYSHYSWHLLARSASADGHGDLKGYLDERSSSLVAMRRDFMPLDIGWYYGYDPNSTIDEYEYILGTTIGYDSSMSFQVSCDHSAHHPFGCETLDLIRRYEKLRLSGRVPEVMRERLRVDPALAGQRTAEERAKLLEKRRDYRLLGPEGNECFQRVIYEPWREITSTQEKDTAWTVRVPESGTRVGVQIHARSGPWLDAGPSYRAADAVMLESFDDLAPYTTDPKNRHDVRAILAGEAGSVSPGVSQRFELSEEGAHEGKRCVVYTAETSQAPDGGWSAIGKQFDPPLDLSWHKGIGFWLRGDGNGGSFKLQLTDGKGAMDYYVANNFAGWRYQQLARPAKDTIDYTKVRTLTFYYNGLPGKTTVSCVIDDVKALRACDEQTLVDPYVEIDGNRWQWRGNLTTGQYLFFWPDEPVTRYGLPLTQPERMEETAPAVVLSAGEHSVKFGCRDAMQCPFRVRVTLQPSERHAVP